MIVIVTQEKKASAKPRRMCRRFHTGPRALHFF